MDHVPTGERVLVVDLESGRTNSIEEAGSPEPLLGSKLEKFFFAKFCRGVGSVDGLVRGENGIGLSSNALTSSGVDPESIKLLDKISGGEDATGCDAKNIGKEKPKKTSAKKAPKPPRPPRGLSLDAADQKLIKEIAELAMKKRARFERLKALKKIKAAKASSSAGSLLATIFTFLFFLVILCQGISSRSSAVSIHTSPESSGATGDGLIIVQDLLKPSASSFNLPGSESPSLVEKVYGSDIEGKVSRVAS